VARVPPFRLHARRQLIVDETISVRARWFQEDNDLGDSGRSLAVFMLSYRICVVTGVTEGLVLAHFAKAQLQLLKLQAII
jgi:hypothetical protein